MTDDDAALREIEQRLRQAADWRQAHSQSTPAPPDAGPAAFTENDVRYLLARVRELEATLRTVADGGLARPSSSQASG